MSGFIVFAFSIVAIQLFGQNPNREKADVQFKLKAYDLAIDSYQEYLSHSADDIVAMGRLASSFERSNDLISAARWYEKIVNNPKHSIFHDVQFGKLLMKLGLYDRAITQFETIKSTNPQISNQFVNSCNFAKNILALGDKYIMSQMRASTSSDEFGVEIKDGKILYCSFNGNENENQSLIQRKANKLMLYDEKTRSKSDFTSGIRDFSGIGPIRYSPSGKFVVYTRNSFVNGNQQIVGDEKDMSIYIAEVNEDGDFINEEALPYNGIDYSTAFACFGENDNELYFSSNKNGKNFDIYFAKKVSGVWTESNEVDKMINTVGNEITPFYVDGVLYFSSDFHNGLGGFDIFKSSIYKNEWSFPVNLGKGVNSPADDLYFVKEPFVNKAYITSNRIGSKGGYDIFSAVPASREINDEIAYEYIPEAVDISNLKDKNGVNVRISNSMNVSSAKDNGLSVVSLEGAKMISYDEVILSPSRVYFIQLASLSSSRVNGKIFKPLTKFGNVYKVNKGRLTKVRLGYFVSEEEAKAVLSSVRKYGFKDAFIVEDLLNTTELELLESDYTFNNSEKYSKPVEIGNYKIKLAAYSNPLYFDVNKVKDLGVIEQWSKGKWTIFVLSGYTGYNDANAAIRKAKNRGFTTAELVIDENGILSKVKKN